MSRVRSTATSRIRSAALRAHLLRYASHRLLQKKRQLSTVGQVRRSKVRRSNWQWYLFGPVLTGLRFVVAAARELVDSFWQSLRYYPVHFVVAVLMSVALVAGSGFLYQTIFKDLPSPQDLTTKQPNLTTKIMDRNGQLLYKMYDDENRTWVHLKDIPRHLVYATIAIEDQDFYYHHGFSVRGILRAIVANAKGEAIQGGSTLTQQLVKKQLLTPERTLTRKVKELLLAVLVEQTYTKDQILEMYLNLVPYGGSAYGVEEAAQRYFGKSAHALTLPESALLAGLPQSPSVYTPFGPTPELALQRQHEVLRRMKEDGYITQEDADRASATPLPLEPDSIPIRAPHFVMYVRHLLAQQYGDDLLNRGGLEVRTTLDLSVQEQAQSTVTSEVEALRRLRISNGAALVTNPQTGEVLAMVGSTDYFDTAHDGQVNVTLSPRQPGSSIKPLMYSMALEHGLTPSSLIEDTPITYNVEGSPPYSPKNYDGKYHGKVTVRESLASSYNIPAVKTLNSLGINPFIDWAENMGITTWSERQRFGLSLTLGGGEVKMSDLAVAYGSFANGGQRVPLNPIVEIRDEDGNVLYHNPCLDDGDSVAVQEPLYGPSERPQLLPTTCERTPVLKPATAFLISNILSDNQARTPAFGPLSVLHIPNQEVAVKTGTTNSLRDNWTIGYTTDRLVAVWVGNNDNTPMSYVASGITGASPIWNKIMLPLLPAEQTHAFAMPEGVMRMAVCATSNTLACAGCPKPRQEYFAVGTQPTGKCDGWKFISETPAKPQPTRSR